ncbi:hypothetical protein ONS95_001155 [Cadophora gregata]|uniref:uncharacterized protein n=1 Tax=Cadophora gregata TaxID=51156 RepID=UPI0026DD6596|nr:uncharacterized protein ONS95_001155 [Cadophora gregata]KAK0129220.1 hypothetical protein ONS95_001155 [Cadophora gregata]
MAETEFHNRNLTSRCEHEPLDMCKTCVATTIETQSQVKIFDDINCPVPDCGLQLNEEEVQEFATAEFYELYRRQARNRRLSRDPNFWECLNKNCRYGDIYESTEGGKITCIECGQFYCLTHRIKWHENSTCENYDLSLDDFSKANEASESLIMNNTKACPKCKVQIEKIDGCEHMIYSCKHEFCYICFAVWTYIVSHNGRGHDENCSLYLRHGGMVLHHQDDRELEFLQDFVRDREDRVRRREEERVITRAIIAQREQSDPNFDVIALDTDSENEEGDSNSGESSDSDSDSSGNIKMRERLRPENQREL